MKKGQTTGHILFILFLVVALAAPALADQHYYVDENGDNRNTGTSADDAWQTITYALNCTTGTASNPVIIHVAAGTYDEDLGEEFPIRPRSYDTIIGAGAGSTVVYGDDSHRVFEFLDVTQTKIQELQVRNGRNKHGGGIYCDEAELEIAECWITRNHSTGTQYMYDTEGSGAGIYSKYSSLNIHDSKFTRNETYTYGWGGGAIFCGWDTETVIDNCVITDNKGRRGGGICLHESPASVTNCQIENNESFKYGGGVWCFSFDGYSPLIENCTIDNNEAREAGGGLCVWEAGSPTVIGTSISGNVITNGEEVWSAGGMYIAHGSSPKVINCVVEDNSGAVLGGGIYIADDSSPTIRWTSVRGNSALRNAGGGGGIAVRGNSSPTIEDCVVEENESDTGGGVWIYENSSPTIENCTIENNKALDRGGGIEIRDYSSPIIAGCTISGNSLTGSSALCGAGVFMRDDCGPVITECVIESNSGAAWGGGIASIHDCAPTITKTRVAYNAADRDDYREDTTGFAAGGIYISIGGAGTIEDCFIEGNSSGRGGGLVVGNDAAIVNCAITGNEASDYGGGIQIAQDCYPTIEGCLISDNSAPKGGGIIVRKLSSPRIVDCEISDNTSTEIGGGVFCDGSIGPIGADMVVEHCTIDGNYAGKHGGGISCREESSPHIDSCVITNNEAGQSGGGLEIYSYSSPTVVNCTIDRNYATTQGGGIYITADSSLALVSTSVSSNSVVDDSDYPAGGGICAYSSQLSIQDCFIDGNTGVTAGGGLVLFTGSSLAASRTSISSNVTDREAQGDYEIKGGGIYAQHDCEMLIDNCVFESNESDQGGAASFACPASFTDCVMRGNQVSARGGAIYCSGQYGPQPVFQNCVFENNSADNGGAFCICGNSEPVINTCVIYQNTATSAGGGIYCLGYDGEIGRDTRIEHCTISGNSASRYGGGVCCKDDSSPTLFNNLIIGNTAGEGSGIGLLNCSSPDILNCTIVDNDGHGLYAGDGSEPTLTNCILWGNDDDLVNVDCSQVSHCDTEDGDCVGENGNFSQNPLFVAGYYLSQTASGQASNSPCANAGDDAASAYGLDEYTTRTDGEYDAGVVDVGYHYPEGTDEEDENHAPVLTSGRVDPDAGTTETLFTYSVHYYDEDGDAPIIRGVCIDGDMGHQMFLQSGEPSNGTYVFERTLNGGEHVFYFYFEEGRGGWDRAPESGYYAGPSVHPDPVLLDGDVDPDYGTSGTIFTYSVRYLGYDDNLPSTKRVFIDDVGHDMTLTIGEPSNGTYTYKTTLVVGKHYFYFYFENAAGQGARNPNTGVFTGPTVFSDLEGPSSCCTGPETSNVSSITIAYISSDDVSGVAVVQLYARHNGGGFAYSGYSSTEPSGSFALELSLGDGIYEFYTIAEDRAGHREAPPETADSTVEADFTMPKSHCWSDDWTSAVPFAVRFEASDSYSGVKETRLWYRFAGESAWINSWLVLPGESGQFFFDPATITPQYGDGEYELMTISIDHAGNVEAPPILPDASIIVDRTPPGSLVTSPRWSSTSPIALPFAALDGLSGIASVALWFSFSGGEWQYSGLSESAQSGAFEFAFPFGDGIYGFVGIATDVAGNTEALSETDASCIFDTSPPISSAHAEGVVNQPVVNVTYRSVDQLTEVRNVHLYYRYSDFHGNPDDTLIDTGLEEAKASGTFECPLQSTPGFYSFYLAGTDVLENMESTEGEPDAVSLYDPALALSTMEAPLYTTQATISITFTIGVADGGFDQVLLYYRYGVTEAEASAAAWITTSTISSEPSGTLEFAREDGDGYYQFFTRARSASGLLEPIPDLPDATTIADTMAPQTGLEVPPTSPTSEFDVTLSIVEPYGIASVEIYCWHAGQWSLFTTVADPDGIVTFDTRGNEGEYRFYSVGTDMAGNVEQKVPEDYCSTLVDLLPPVSVARTESFGTGFPIEISYTASDTVSDIVSVALWARFGSSEWVDTGLSSTSSSGLFGLNPPSAEAKEGIYYFYTVAVDEMGHVEQAPASADAQTIIDWTPPVTSCSAPPYSRNGMIELAYSASDAMSGIISLAVWIKPGDGEWLDAGLSRSSEEGVIEVDVSAFGEGAFGLCVRGLDKAGNRQDLPEAPPINTIYDASAPESQVTLPAEGVYANHAPVDLPFAASDVASGVASVELWFRFDGGSWTNSGLVDVPPLLNESAFGFTPPSGDGTYEFASLAIDKAGNRELLPEAHDGGALTFDRTSPTSTVSFDGIYASTFPITLSFEAQDETSGIANVALLVSINGSDYESTGLESEDTSGSFYYTPDTIIDGTYRFIGAATDLCGNVESAAPQADATVVFDATAPESFASVPSEYTNRFPLSVSFAANDPTSGIAEVRLYVSFSGGAFADTGLTSRKAAGTFTYVPRALMDGTYEFYTTARDLAGNIEPTKEQADASAVMDSKRPTSSCSIAETLTNSFPIRLSYASSDELSGIERLELYGRVNGGEWACCARLTEPTGAFDFTPAAERDGYYEFYMLAFDKASNRETTQGVEDAITVDTTRPESFASSPASAESLPISVSFTASDDGSGVASTALWFKQNNGLWTDAGLSRAGTIGDFEFYAPNGPGTYSLCTISTDLAGNVEALPTSPDARCVYSVPAPDIRTSAERLSFGEVAVAGQRSKTLTVSNVGNADLMIADASITDVLAGDSAFAVAAQTDLPTTLAPGEGLEIIVSFSPDSESEYSADFTITSNDPETPELMIGLSGRGTVGELIMDVWTDADYYSFNDRLRIGIGCHNTDMPRTVDAYLLLTFDPAGPEERTWSATLAGDWAEGITPLVSGFPIPAGFDFSTEWWTSRLPCPTPLISRTGTYLLRIGAVEVGTFELVSNLSQAAFSLDAEPFVNVSTQSSSFWLLGDTALISMDVHLPPYSMSADLVIVVLTPAGLLFSPQGFGTNVQWRPGILPVASGLVTTPGMTLRGVFWEVKLPGGAPFNWAGRYMLFAAPVEPGTLTPLSDIGAAEFLLQ